MEDGEEVFEQRMRAGSGLLGHYRPSEGEVCDPGAMPRPARRAAPPPDDRQDSLSLAKVPAQPKAPTPETVAKIVTDRDPSPPGQPDLAQITLRLALPRAAIERLRARAIRDGRNLEGLIAEILASAK